MPDENENKIDPAHSPGDTIYPGATDDAQNQPASTPVKQLPVQPIQQKTTPVQSEPQETTPVQPQQVGSINQVSETPLPETSIPVGNSRRKALFVLVFSFILLVSGGTGFFLLSRGDNSSASLTDAGPQGSSAASKSLLGYLNKLDDGTSGSLSIEYDGVRAGGLELEGLYLVQDGTTYFDLIEDPKNINLFLQFLFEKESDDETSKFDENIHGAPQFFTFTIGDLIGLNDFEVPKNEAELAIFQQSFSKFAGCDEQVAVSEFVNNATTSQFPLIPTGSPNEFTLNLDQYNQVYAPLVEAFFDNCVTPNIKEVDKTFFEDLRNAATSTRESSVLVTLEDNGDKQSITINSPENEKGVIKITIGAAESSDKVFVTNAQPIYGIVSEFVLTMESCRHAPVVGSRFLGGNYEFVSLSTGYNYPSSVDSVFGCSTREPGLDTYRPNPIMSLLLKGDRVPINNDIVDELTKVHELGNAIEQFYKEEGSYPLTDQILSLMGEFLEDTDFEDFEGSKVNSGAISYNDTGNGSGYLLILNLKTPNDATVEISKQNYNLAR